MVISPIIYGDIKGMIYRYCIKMVISWCNQNFGQLPSGKLT